MVNVRKIKQPEITGGTKYTKLRQLMCMRLMEIDYAAYEECKFYANPKVKDFKMIPNIIGLTLEEVKLENDNYAFIIAVCYYLTAPYKLLGYPIKLPTGFRDLMRESLAFNSPESVNAYSDYIPPLYKSPRYKQRLHEFGDKIFERMKLQNLITDI